MFAPLDGLTVVDLTHVLAGPYCTQLLAHLGADVIKVEPPGLGDLTRWGGEVPELNTRGLGLAFCAQNTDKTCVTADLKEAGGVEIVHRLVADADVFVENFRPGVAERLGLGYEALTAMRPSLVYVSITAYGQDGPLGHRPAYDHVVQAMSGIMETTGTDETGPVKVGAPYVDYATGQKAAFATLAAVMEQRRTGAAQRVDVAMLDSALLLMANTLTGVANTGRRPPKLGNDAASGAASSGCFDTADGLLAIAANNERQFQDLCAAVDRPELVHDERFAEPTHRRGHAVEFRDILAGVLRSESAAHWEERLDSFGVPASRIRSMDELLEEGQPQARGLLAEVSIDGDDTPLVAQIPTAGFKANGEVPGRDLTAPRPLGADNRRVLERLGYSSDAIIELERSGVT